MDDASWVMGFLDVLDPALDSIKRLLNLDQGLINKAREPPKDAKSIEDGAKESLLTTLGLSDGNGIGYGSRFDLDAFIKDKLSLDPSKLDILMENSGNSSPKRVTSPRRMWRSQKRTTMTLP